ncbi:CBS domain-containing protein [Clostridiisalibacter paucivorans]|uniref:CBS domain-containing protein n=1 Tax=Clostridiisalibacter paucivorans TaxID=408753 RepID=UPI0006840D0B|nr:CBS domain-containing protein [Clostridiisalibacter paucivorans]
MFSQSYDIPAKKVMSKDFIIVKENINMDDVSNILIKNIGREVFVINNSNKLVGIITLKDLYNICKSSSNYKQIRKFILKDIIHINPDVSLLNCRNIMVYKNIGRLPVIENEKLIGVIRQEHIRDYLYMGIEKTDVILKYILNNINEAICFVDDEGKVVIWNNNAEKLYGISTSEIRGKYLKDYFPNAIDVKLLSTRKPVKNIYHTPRDG